MKYPKKRIKIRETIYTIINNLMRSAREIEIKYPEAAVSAVAAHKITELIHQNYRRRVK